MTSPKQPPHLFADVLLRVHAVCAAGAALVFAISLKS